MKLLKENHSNHQKIKARKLDPVKGTAERFNPNKNSWRKDDFKAFVPVLKDSLQDYLSQTADINISLLGLISLVENALNKAEAHKAIRSRIQAKVEANSSSKAALLQYLYNFILQHEAVGAIDQNIKVKWEEKAYETSRNIQRLSRYSFYRRGND